MGCVLIAKSHRTRIESFADRLSTDRLSTPRHAALLEKRRETVAFPAGLQHRDREIVGTGIGFRVPVGGPHSGKNLAPVGFVSHPHKDLPPGVQQKDVAVVQGASVEAWCRLVLSNGFPDGDLLEWF